jgi:peptidoglycan/LPS O-acetylase OafA/YrhL
LHPKIQEMFAIKGPLDTGLSGKEETLPGNDPFITNLTPLRGIAAILVVIFHFEIVLVLFLPRDISRFFSKCYLMVDLFFIMSGFIIYHVYGEFFKHNIHSKTFNKYIRARLARVYPLHIFTLILTIILVIGAHFKWDEFFNLRAIPTHVLMLQSFGLHSIYTWNVPAWSISAEFAAYIIFPLFAFMLYRFKIATPVVISAIIIFIYCLLAFKLSKSNGTTGLYNLDQTYDYGYLRGIAGFLAGGMIYQLYLKKMFHILKNDTILVILFALLFACLHFGVTDLVFIPVFLLLVLSAAYNTGRVKRFLDNRVMQWLGDISYSVYLMQFPLMLLVIAVLRRLGISWNGPYSFHIPYWQAALCCILFLAVLIGLSALSYQFIERPFRKLINNKIRGINWMPYKRTIRVSDPDNIN